MFNYKILCMIILSIDPGIKNIGLSIMKFEGTFESYVDINNKINQEYEKYNKIIKQYITQIKLDKMLHDSNINLKQIHKTINNLYQIYKVSKDIEKFSKKMYSNCLEMPPPTTKYKYQMKNIDKYLNGIRKMIISEMVYIKKYNIDVIVIEVQPPSSGLHPISIGIGSMLMQEFKNADIVYLNGNEKKIPKEKKKETVVAKRLKIYNEDLYCSNDHINDATYNAIIAWQKIEL